MPTRQIATSTLWQLASQITMAALSILAIKFVAIGLSKELAGYYNSAFGFLQLFGILADFGLYAVAVREVSRTKRRGEVLGALIILRFCILLISLGSALCIAWLVPLWRGTPLPLAISIAAFVPFFTLLAGILRTVFQVTYTMHWVFIAEVTQRIITVSAIGAFIVYGFRQSTDTRLLYAFLAIGGIGAFVLFVISLAAGYRLLRVQWHVPTAVIRSLLMQATPFGVAFFCLALYRNFDTTLIALLRDDFDLQNAYYGFTMRMVEMGYLIPTFLLNSTLPVLTGTGDDQERSILGKTFLALLVLGSISLLFSAFWARPLVQMLTTSAYLSTASRPGSDSALLLMSAPMLLNGIVTYCFYVLLSQHKWRGLVAALVCGAAFSIALNIAFIPSLGFRGAAMTAIATNVLLTIVLFPQAQRVLPMLITRSQLLRWGIFSLLLAAALWVYRPMLTSELATVFGLISIVPLMGIFVVLCGLHRVLLYPRSETNTGGK
ncbi:MAG: oligosaccharide flippase family protein [Candidatus Peribacteraceae bacterium]|nr:oligosaccharide flippase family protein [Candidatus Peribacteraceae bacterium]